MKLDLANAKPEGRAEFPRLSLKKDETARICILTTKDWEVSLRHFINGVGYVHCHAMKDAKDEVDLLRIEEEGGNPDTCIMCKMSLQGENGPVGRPYRRFALRVLRYGTDLYGKVTLPLKYYMEIWIISNEKYRQLRRIVDEWGKLSEHDLTLTCSDAAYQKISIDVKKEAAWVKEKDNIIAYWKAEVGKYKLDECLGNTYDEEALRKRLSLVSRRGAKVSAPVELEDDSIFASDSSPKATVSSGDLFSTDEQPVVTPVDTLDKTKFKEESEPADFLAELDLK
jgi:hypothetical protein